MNTISMNNIPSPNAQCFQNFFVILKILIIITTPNNGGNNNANARRPDIPPSLSINTILYTGIKTPHPGSPAFLKILHREIIINTPTAKQIVIRAIMIHHIAAQNTPLIHIIASGLMFHVIIDPSTFKEKFICFCKINKIFL